MNATTQAMASSVVDLRTVEFRAGGTDLSERRRSGVSRGAIVDLEPTAEMLAIGWGAGGAARIGAMTTIETLATDARLKTAYPGLAAAAGGLATPQIRAVGTVGGNLAQRTRCWYFRNPHTGCLKKGAADCPARAGNHLYGVAFDLGPCVAPHPSTLAAALIAYDATVTTSQRTAITVGALIGDGADGSADNTLAPGERILHIDMAAPVPGERAAYRRAISRTYAEWPLVEVVVRAVVAQRRCTFARIAAGGIAPVPLRFRPTEDALQSGTLDAAAIQGRGGARAQGRQSAAARGLQAAAARAGAGGRDHGGRGLSRPWRRMAASARLPAKAVPGRMESDPAEARGRKRL